MILNETELTSKNKALNSTFLTNKNNFSSILRSYENEELKQLNKSLRDGQLYYMDGNGIPQKPYARILIRKKQ
jgi:hypothetical protein